MSQRISPSLVISIIALIVALGGVSYAAIQIPKNSVGTKQLKKNSVNSAKVKNRTLLRSDFKPGQLPGATWYKDRRPSVPLFDVTESFAPVVTTVKLPVGSYVLSGRANVISGGVTSSLICSLGGDAAQNFTVGNSEMLPLALSSVAILDEPETISLSCLKTTGTPQIAQAHIIATRVTRVVGFDP